MQQHKCLMSTHGKNYRTRMTPETQAMICTQYWDKTRTVTSIAKEHGVDTASIYCLLRRRGIPTRTGVSTRKKADKPVCEKKPNNNPNFSGWGY